MIEIGDHLRHAREASLRNGFLDGEFCLLRADGRPTFSGSRAAIGRKDAADLVFFVFDVLSREQDDLRSLKDRKEILARLAGPIAGKRVRRVETFATGGGAIQQAARRSDLEGVVSTLRDSKYTSSRLRAWAKTVCVQGQEFVSAVGIRRPTGGSRPSWSASMAEKGSPTSAGGRLAPRATQPRTPEQAVCGPEPQDHEGPRGRVRHGIERTAAQGIFAPL